MPMIERFEGTSGQRAFYEAMLTQHCVCHSPDVAKALCAAATLSELNPGDMFIETGGHDNDIFFILAGRVSIDHREEVHRLSHSKQRLSRRFQNQSSPRLRTNIRSCGDVWQMSLANAFANARSL
jgi:hypothetical protein